MSPRLAALWLWVLVVVLYFAWEAATYSGLFAILAEWQFDRLGQDLPTFNFCLLTMALAWPALLVLRRGADLVALAAGTPGVPGIGVTNPSPGAAGSRPARPNAA